ncbi:unnamed protein product [Phytomonas sp. Hart1]|nr:unnamed protein product [Phytomonas sp. Hart1]|eukprot:CCW69258.1 unnamed protein product [Phytomonas sp. isolate Hart1]
MKKILPENSSPSKASSTLEELRQYNSFLQAEHEFLEYEVNNNSEMFSQLTSRRRNVIFEEYQHLKLYLEALQLGDTNICLSIEEELLRKHMNEKRKASELESLLHSVRAEVHSILAHSASK